MTSRESFYIAVIFIAYISYIALKSYKSFRCVKLFKNFQISLNLHDKVRTTGGIYGEIVYIDENKIHLKIYNNVQIIIDRAAIVWKEVKDEK